MPKEQRILACKLHFGYFLAYYLPHYIQTEFAHYHYDMMQDWHDLMDLKIRELAWIMYRESAKTSFAKGGLLFLICYGIEPYLNADAFDSDNSERVLYDVVWELQTNPRIIEDFGQLYNQERTASQVTQKRVKNFVTNPDTDQDGRILKLGSRVEAHSTQEPVRGRTHGATRPGFVLLDDFETKKTVASKAATDTIREHIQEFKGGLDSSRRRVLYLANYISEYANVQLLIDRAKRDPELRVRIVPIWENGQPTWPQRWAATDEEAAATGKPSIPAKKRSMWTPENGDADFMAEMECQPVDFTRCIFQRHYFQTITWEALIQKKLACYVTIDTPAKREDQAQSNDGDFFGITINWVDQEGRWHFKAYRKRLSPTAIIEEMFNVYLFLANAGTTPIKMGWEDTAFTRGLEPSLRAEMRRRLVFLPLIWLSTQGRAKVDRIRTGLLHRYETRMIYHLVDECSDLEGELLRYPKAPNDDTSDSAGYQQDIAKPYGVDKVAERELRTLTNDPYQRRRTSIYENEDSDPEVLHRDIGI